MRHLTEFFDSERFFRDKVLIATGCEEWRDFDNKQNLLGTKVNVVIYQDNTSYQQKQGQVTTNMFEKLTIKVKQPKLQIAPKSKVVLVNPTCRVYGEYSNMLSVTCDDLQVISAKS